MTRQEKIKVKDRTLKPEGMRHPAPHEKADVWATQLPDSFYDLSSVPPAYDRKKYAAMLREALEPFE